MRKETCVTTMLSLCYQRIKGRGQAGKLGASWKLGELESKLEAVKTKRLTLT